MADLADLATEFAKRTGTAIPADFWEAARDFAAECPIRHESYRDPVITLFAQAIMFGAASRSPTGMVAADNDQQQQRRRRQRARYD